MRKGWPLLFFTAWMLLAGFCAVPSALAAKSSELASRRTDTEKGYRIDYVDAEGNVALATDKGYASMERVVENGQTVEEYYFDELGEPTSVSGYYGRVNLYEDGQCVQITYLDKQGEPTRNSSGYAIAKRTVNEKGHVVKELYFDAKGEIAELNAGHSGLLREVFDEYDRVIQYTYIDEDEKPVMLSSGYSTVKRTYSAAGADTEMYFDTDGNPAMRSTGEYGVKYIRDEAGKRVGTTYLDQDGQPMTNTLGYMTVRYAYDDWNHVIEYLYYDAADEPFALSRGQYGKRLEYDGKKLLRTYYVDAQGKELFLLDQFLLQNLWVNVLAAVCLVLCALYLPERVRKGMLLCYAAFILYMTLAVRESGDQRSNLELFWSYRQFFTSDTLRAEIVNNILLFIPLGALLCSLNPCAALLGVMLLFSAGIEAVQYGFRLGLCELDDVLSNGMGGMLGWYLTAVLRKRAAVRKTGKTKADSLKQRDEGHA